MFIIIGYFDSINIHGQNKNGRFLGQSEFYIGCNKSTGSRPRALPSSVAVLAEILLKWPRFFFIFIIKKFSYRIKVSKKQLI